MSTQLINVSKVKQHMSGKPSLEIGHVTSTPALLLLEHLIFPPSSWHAVISLTLLTIPLYNDFQLLLSCIGPSLVPPSQTPT